MPRLMYLAVAVLVAASCALAQDSQSPQDLLKEAVTAQQAGHLDQAIRVYRILLNKYPDIAEIRSNLGAALAGEGLYHEAVVEYERALRVKPDPKVRLNLGLAYYKTDQLSLAVETLQKVHKEEPANVQVVTILADCHLRLGQNKEVIDLLTSLQSENPDDKAFNYLLGTALVRDGQIAKGQVIIDKILKNGDSAEARLLMGTTKFMVKDFAGALADFQKAVELNPNLPDVYAYYGLALLSTGDQENAKKAFERELKSDPNNFDANLRMGVLLRQDDDPDAALKFFGHALEIRPGDFGVRYQIASVKLGKGQLEDARRDLETLVKQAPQFTEAHVSLATVYFREKKKADGDRERAIVLKLNAARQAKEPGVAVH
ncbi:MAG: tetratricopeptide repeat protein [Bryobacteraceae bacterium]